MFENKLTHNGIHYSRYIASWRREGGKIYRGGLFERWLKETQHLTDEEVDDILLMAENGKMELESSASAFMKEHENAHWEERKLANAGGMFTDCTGKHIRRIKNLWDIATKRFKQDD